MFLKSIFVQACYVWRRVCEMIWGNRNWKIYKVAMSYTHTPVEDEDDYIFDPFWDREARYWDDEKSTSHYMDVTRDYNVGLLSDVEIPVSVDDIVLSVSYTYNNKTWKYFTRDLDFDWAPVQSGTFKFCPPYVKAELLDENNNVVKVVTGKFKKYAGPFGDFFSEPDIRPIDLFPYKFKKLRVLNMLNQTKEFSLMEPIQLP